MRSEREDREQESRVLIGNEAGRYLASLIRAHLAGVDDEKVVPWRTVRELLAGWADDIEAKAQGSDEQVAYEKGREAAFAEAMRTVAERQRHPVRGDFEGNVNANGRWCLTCDSTLMECTCEAYNQALVAALASITALATPPDTGTP